MILAAKIATLIGWLAIIANWIIPFPGTGLGGMPLADVLHYSGLGLAAAHAVEVAIFLPKAKKLGGNLALHALQLFLFGFAHNMALDQQLKQQAA